jgi:RNA polymerase sigma factor (sigma-70 family)
MWKRERVVDEMLVLAAQSGQVEAFDLLATRWHPRLLRHARRLTGDPDGAQEVVQESWVAIARGLRRLHDTAAFTAWALRIVSRRCSEWIARRQQTRRQHTALDAEPELAAPTDARNDNLARVRDAIRHLDREPRALLAMFYIEGLSVAEIARVLEIPSGTVKSRLFHAREKLRAAMEV